MGPLQVASWVDGVHPEFKDGCSSLAAEEDRAVKLCRQCGGYRDVDDARSSNLELSAIG
jgi:hypothetical protein